MFFFKTCLQNSNTNLVCWEKTLEEIEKSKLNEKSNYIETINEEGIKTERSQQSEEDLIERKVIPISSEDNDEVKSDSDQEKK